MLPPVRHEVSNPPTGKSSIFSCPAAEPQPGITSCRVQMVEDECSAMLTALLTDLLTLWVNDMGSRRGSVIDTYIYIFRLLGGLFQGKVFVVCQA